MPKFCHPSTVLVRRNGTPGRARRATTSARRADRLPSFLGLRHDADEVLGRLKVLIAGTGSVGATAALSLARLHLAELRFVDRGRFKPASLLTQPVAPESLGRPKASHIAELCRPLSPSTRVRAFDCSFQELALADIAGVDLVVLAGDNLTVARDVGQRCLELGLPLLHAAVHGDTMTAQCRLFGTRRSGPCPACLFGPTELAMLEAERVWSCEGFHQPRLATDPGRERAAAQSPSSARDPATARPTMSVRPLCALAGEMAGLHVIRWALELGEPALDTMTEFCAYTWRTFVTPLRRNPHCPCQHARWNVRFVTGPLAERSPAFLAGLPETGSGAAALRKRARASSIAVGGFAWVEQARCQCPSARAVERFIAAGAAARPRCSRCGGPAQPQPFYTQATVSYNLLGERVRCPLRVLGAGTAREAVVRQGNQTTLWLARESNGGAR